MVRNDADAESIEVEDERSVIVSHNDHPTMIEVIVGDGVVIADRIATVTAVRADPIEIDVERLGWSATITSGWWKCSRCDRLSVEPSRGTAVRICSDCKSKADAERRRRCREEHEQELRNAIMKDPSEAMLRSTYDDGGDE